MVIHTNSKSFPPVFGLNSSPTTMAQRLARLRPQSNISPGSGPDHGQLEHLGRQIDRIDAAKANLGHAIAFTEAQDSLLIKVGDAFNRMSELTLLAQDETRNDEDRALFHTEYTRLSACITRIAAKDFNGVRLFSSASMLVSLETDGNTVSMSGIDFASASYRWALSASLADRTSALTAFQSLKNAIHQLMLDRAAIGAFQSRLNFTADQLTISRENLVAASPRSQSLDDENQFSCYQALLQSGTAMLARSRPQHCGVLQLVH